MAVTEPRRPAGLSRRVTSANGTQPDWNPLTQTPHGRAAAEHAGERPAPPRSLYGRTLLSGRASPGCGPNEEGRRRCWTKRSASASARLATYRTLHRRPSRAHCVLCWRDGPRSAGPAYLCALRLVASPDPVSESEYEAPPMGAPTTCDTASRDAGSLLRIHSDKGPHVPGLWDMGTLVPSSDDAAGCARGSTGPGTRYRHFGTCCTRRP
jgi:hypothetical protein